MSLFRVTKEVNFCYGHRVPNHGSKCRDAHGHNCKLEVTVEGPLVEDGRCHDEGMVMDFSAIKEKMLEVAAFFDHRFIVSKYDSDFWGSMQVHQSMSGVNEVGAAYKVTGFGWVQFMDSSPTAENMAYLIYKMLRRRIDHDEVQVLSVRFWETPTSMAEYVAGTGVNAFQEDLEELGQQRLDINAEKG